MQSKTKSYHEVNIVTADDIAQVGPPAASIKIKMFQLVQSSSDAKLFHFVFYNTLLKKSPYHISRSTGSSSYCTSNQSPFILSLQIAHWCPVHFLIRPWSDTVKTVRDRSVLIILQERYNRKCQDRVYVKLEIVDQWSTRIPAPPPIEGSKGQWVDCNWGYVRLLPTATKDKHMKFETQIPKQTWVTLPKPCRLQSLETEKSNMATRQPYRKWGNWKSIGSYLYTEVLGHWSFEFIFKAKLKLESGNQKNPFMASRWPFWKWRHWKSIGLYPYIYKYFATEVDIQSQTKVRVRKPKIQYGRQAAILKLISLKINRLLPIYVSVVPLKFGVDIQSQTKVRVWKTRKSKMAARRPFWK